MYAFRLELIDISPGDACARIARLGLSPLQFEQRVEELGLREISDFAFWLYNRSVVWKAIDRMPPEVKRRRLLEKFGFSYLRPACPPPPAFMGVAP